MTGPQTVPFIPPARTNGERSLPQLIDFGGEQCIPCKMMDVVLDQLAGEYGGRLIIRYVNIYERAGHRYIKTSGKNYRAETGYPIPAPHRIRETL